EIEYVTRQMELNPTGLMSVVSDAYDYWRMLTVTLPAVKDKILARDGKYVVRPDSGDPMKILCGSCRSVQNLENAHRWFQHNSTSDQEEVVEYENKFYKFTQDSFTEVEPTP